MPDPALDKSVNPAPSTPTPAANPIETAHIETPEFSQNALQTAIAGGAAAPHAPTVGIPNQPVAGVTPPTTPQSGVITIGPAAHGPHHQVIQVLILNSPGGALNTYQPLPSSLGPQASPQPSNTPSNSYQTQPSSFAGSTIPAGAAPAPSTPSPTPQTPSSFFSSSPSPTTPASTQTTSSAPTSSGWPASQQPPAQAQQTAPAPLKDPPSLGQLANPQASLQSGSIANHIQNLLAGIATGHHTNGTFPSQLTAPNQAAFSGSPSAQIQPTSPSLTTNAAVAQPSEGSPPAMTTRETSRVEQNPRERPAATSPETRADIPTQAPPQTPPATGSALESAIRAISSLPAQDTAPRSTPPPPPQPETISQPSKDIRLEPNKSATPPITPDQREQAASTPNPTTQPLPTPTLRPDQAPQQIAIQLPPPHTPTTSDTRVEPSSSVKQPELLAQAPLAQRAEISLEPRAPNSQSELTLQPLPQRLEQQATVRNEQRQQENVEQRIERIRDIQQISATEREATTPTRDRAPHDTDLRKAPEREPSHIAVERVRESILESLTSIQSRLETLMTDRQRVDDVRSSATTQIQGRDILVRPDPLDRDVQPSLITKLAERLLENQQHSRGAREAITVVASTAVAERAHIRHTDPTSSQTQSLTRPILRAQEHRDNRPERFTNLIDLLKRFSQRSVNFKLLNKMDTSLEKACLTIATGAAVGIVGIGFLYRSINLAALHTLDLLRDKRSRGTPLEHKDTQLEQQLADALKDFTTTQLATVGEQGFVVDLAGMVVTADGETPLPSVAVSCAEYGTTYTDSRGLFLFPNLPLGAPYTITVSSPQKAFEPIVVSGVCGELEFLKIRVNQTTVVI